MKADSIGVHLIADLDSLPRDIFFHDESRIQ